MKAGIPQSELLHRLHAGYRAFHALIDPLDAGQLQQAGVIGDWSVKDLVAHFIAHEQFALAELSAARRGEQYQPEFGDTDTLNAEAVARYAVQPVAAVLAAWQVSFRQLVAAVESLSAAEYADDGMLARCLNDTIEGALANNSYEHYAEHRPAVEAWIAHIRSAG
jgi:uncharacterized protein (TIGR03083 family)